MANVFELTKRLIDIESITENEREIGDYLFDYVSDVCRRFGGQAERMPVAPNRFNVFAHFGEPFVVFSTHMDTVPPFIPASEDEQHIFGRGACDTKGIIAAMMAAAEELLEIGERNLGLLFVVGEERNSAGALFAAKQARGCRHLINGEPTGNKLAMAHKGALRFVMQAHGRMAHSAYPELGESAVLKLLDALDRIRKLPLPSDELLGPCTLNIATLKAGRAPNVIPDEAVAELFIRVVGSVDGLRNDVRVAAGPDAEVEEELYIPAVRLGSLPGFETCVVAFTTDIPAFGDAWGKPYLIGPGSIHVAHTSEERIAKRELKEAVALYRDLGRKLLQEESAGSTALAHHE